MRRSLAPSATQTASGPTATAVPGATLLGLKGAGIDADDGAVGCGRHPGCAEAGRDVLRAGQILEGVSDGVRRGSNIESLSTNWFATQTNRSPAATLRGFSPALKVSTTARDSGSISEIVPDPRLATQSRWFSPS